MSLPSKIYRKARSIYNYHTYPYTPANIRNKVIFVHVPKAAGSAVRRALGEPNTGRRHLPWWVYQQASPKKFEEYFKFAFVRDPVARTLSAYNYLLSGGNQMEDLEAADRVTNSGSFLNFLNNELVEGGVCQRRCRV